MNQKLKLDHSGQRGAALVTVLLAALLLGTACIALLSAVGASSQNNTDALSEAKAYWAAESGLQSTINILRNTPNMNYNTALGDPDLSTWLPYGADGKVTVDATPGNYAAYSVEITNPDSTLPYQFYTTGSFNATSATGVTISNTTPPKICFPNCDVTTVDRVEVTFTGVGSSTRGTDNSQLGTFAVNRFGAGYAIPAGITFRIEFEMTSPRQASRTIRGKIGQATANGAINITFDSQVAELVGSDIELCSTQTVPGTPPPSPNGLCPTVSFTLASGVGSGSYPLYAALSAAEPYRLKVVSTGYGPNSSQKKLEGVIIKDLLFGLPTTSALTMVGPGASINFAPGSGSPTYCGVDPGIDDGEPIPKNNELTCTPDPNTPTAPAIGVSDQDGLDGVNEVLAANKTKVIPAPDVITDGPEWLESATAFHNYINDLRVRAQNSGLYIPDTNGPNSVTDLSKYLKNNDATIGNFNTGGGITFCEGDCNVGPESGGGILVVNGNFNYDGKYNHRGTIIVVGDMSRNGGGSGVILGSVIIADYDRNNLAGGFLPPSFSSNGSGTADIIYNGAADAFDGTASVTNIMIGVAEK